MSVHSPQPPDDDDKDMSVHDLCVDISQDLGLVSQKLAHAGASPQALSTLGHMKQVIDQMTKVLAQAPDVEDAAKNGPAGGPSGPMAPAHPGNTDPGDQPPVEDTGPGNPTPGAPGGPPPRGPFGPAAAALHHAMSGNARGANS